MKLTKTSLVIASLLPIMAMADGDKITPYGIFDVGVASQSATAAGGSNTGFAAGLVLPVILGIAGSHDLPNGNKVNFKLESGLNPETGAAGFAKNSNWGRGATIGFSGNWGSITGGMETTPFLTDLGSVDPLGLSQGGSALIPYLDALGIVGIFDDRMFQYRSPDLGGLKFTAGLGTGNVPGNASQGRELQGTVTYANGPFNFGAGALNVNGDAVGVGKVSSYWLGGGYKLGALSLKALLQDNKTGAGARHTQLIGAGLGYQISPSLNVAYGIYDYADQDNSANKTLLNSVLGKYSLDSATTLYMGVTVADNKGAMQVAPLAASSFGGNTPPTNTATNAVFVGMHYIF